MSVGFGALSWRLSVGELTSIPVMTEKNAVRSKEDIWPTASGLSTVTPRAFDRHVPRADQNGGSRTWASPHRRKTIRGGGFPICRSSSQPGSS